MEEKNLTRELLSFPHFVNALHQRGKQHRLRMPFLPRKVVNWMLTLVPWQIKYSLLYLLWRDIINSTINLVTRRRTLIKPNAMTGRGTMRANGIKEARKRSSGYQAPFRLFRHQITVRSEIRPAMLAPTKEDKSIYMVFEYVEHDFLVNYVLSNAFINHP